MFIVRALPISPDAIAEASTSTSCLKVFFTLPSRSSTGGCWPEDTVTGTRQRSFTTAVPSFASTPELRSASILSKATRMSAVPSWMIGEATDAPKRTWLVTDPPRWAMPWISDFFTSYPAIAAALARMSAARMMPCPPTPTSDTFTVFISPPPSRP